MATNFLQATGGSSLGFITSSAQTLVSSEIVSLASSQGVTSASVFVSSGNFGQAIWAEAYVYWGGAITAASGGCVSCWWLKSIDGGTTFETSLSSNLPMPRNPDFVVPLSTAAYASSGIAFAAGYVKMPWPVAKLYVQNNAGANFPSSASQYTVIAVGPTAIQY